MYDLNFYNLKKERNQAIFVTIVCALFFVVGIVVLFSGASKKNELSGETTSTGVDVKESYSDGSTMYSPTYYYVVDGVEYSCPSTSSSSSYPKSETKIYYDEANPSKCYSEYSAGSNNLFGIVFAGMGGFATFFAIIKIKSAFKRIGVTNKLNQCGKLIKNLPYTLEPTGTVINGIPVMRVVVDYTLPSGSKIKLYGDPRHDKRNHDADGMVDLLINENNIDEYFIDFEINRLSGNLASDYYQQPVNNTAINQNPAMVQSQPINQNPYNNYPPQM